MAPLEVHEGTLDDPHLVAPLERGLQLRLLRALFHLTQDPLHLVGRQRPPAGARAHEPRHLRRRAHEVPRVVGQLHLHEEVAREELLLDLDLLALADLPHLLGRHHHPADHRPGGRRSWPATRWPTPPCSRTPSRCARRTTASARWRSRSLIGGSSPRSGTGRRRPRRGRRRARTPPPRPPRWSSSPRRGWASVTRRNSAITSRKNCWIRLRNSMLRLSLVYSTARAAGLPQRNELAGVEGFEPPSPGFGVQCSSR